MIWHKPDFGKPTKMNLLDLYEPIVHELQHMPCISTLVQSWAPHMVPEHCKGSQLNIEPELTHGHCCASPKNSHQNVIKLLIIKEQELSITSITQSLYLRG